MATHGRMSNLVTVVPSENEALSGIGRDQKALPGKPAGGMDFYRILLVDGHPIVRLGLKTALEAHKEFRVLGEASTRDQAIGLAGELQPDIVIFDLSYAGRRSGLELARAIRSRWPRQKLFVLSGRAYEFDVRCMMDAGVDGFLLKDALPAHIVDALKTIMTGNQVLSSTIRSVLREERAGTSPYDRMTTRQLEILRRLAEGQVNEEIADALGVTVKAVQIHLTSIYEKLGARTRTEAVVFAAQRGIVALTD
ncbi:MAG: response regulator transcription factor [Chloroflexi bacterium]|nr:response regulator transcription factor [Chloroflexota bacterium]